MLSNSYGVNWLLIVSFINVLRRSLSNFPLVFAEVTFPSPHHQWSVSNCSVAQVDSMLGVINALTLGETTVIVEDTRVDGHSQLSSLNVVLPDTLSLYISLLSTSGDPLEGMEPIPSVAHWYVVSGKQYLIQLKVFSQGPYSHEIYITEVNYELLIFSPFSSDIGELCCLCNIKNFLD